MKVEVREPEIPKISPSDLASAHGKWIPAEELLPIDHGDYLGVVEWEENANGPFSPSLLVLKDYKPIRPTWRSAEFVYYNPLGSTPLWQALRHGRDWVKVLAWTPIPKIEQEAK